MTNKYPLPLLPEPLCNLPTYCQDAIRQYTRSVLDDHLNAQESAIEADRQANRITGETSDGYHTFNELYAHRVRLFCLLMHAHKGSAWWSRKHPDGSAWEGWVIAGIDTPEGSATYHLPVSEIENLPEGIELPNGKEWDGHTSDDVLVRLLSLRQARGEPFKSRRIDDVVRGLQASVAVGSDGQWVSVRREARDAAINRLQELNSDCAHMYESYVEAAARPAPQPAEHSRDEPVATLSPELAGALESEVRAICAIRARLGGWLGKMEDSNWKVNGSGGPDDLMLSDLNQIACRLRDLQHAAAPQPQQIPTGPKSSADRFFYEAGFEHGKRAASQQPPEGYKLVPVEPTEEMIEAADRTFVKTGHVATGKYKAMLEAAPEPKEP